MVEVESASNSYTFAHRVWSGGIRAIVGAIETFRALETRDAAASADWRFDCTYYAILATVGIIDRTPVAAGRVAKRFGHVRGSCAALALICDGYPCRVRAAFVPISNVVRAADGRVVHGAGDWLRQVAVCSEVIPLFRTGAVCKNAEASLPIGLIRDFEFAAVVDAEGAGGICQ